MNVEELVAKLNGSGVLAGLDLGATTIGLALSDAHWQFATPLLTLKRTQFTKDVEALQKILGGRDVKAFILGLPLNMDGTEGRQAQSTRSFARNIAPLLPLPLLLWDERLTSFEAEDRMKEAGIPHSKWNEHIDAHAAAVILQSALDALRRLPAPRLCP